MRSRSADEIVTSPAAMNDLTPIAKTAADTTALTNHSTSPSSHGGLEGWPPNSQFAMPGTVLDPPEMLGQQQTQDAQSSHKARIDRELTPMQDALPTIESSRTSGQIDAELISGVIPTDSTPPTLADLETGDRQPVLQLGFGQVMLPEAYQNLLDIAPPRSLLRMLSDKCASDTLPSPKANSTMPVLSPSSSQRTSPRTPNSKHATLKRAGSDSLLLAHPRLASAASLGAEQVVDERSEMQSSDDNTPMSAAKAGPWAMRGERIPSALSDMSRDTTDLIRVAMNMNSSTFQSPCSPASGDGASLSTSKDSALRSALAELRAENVRLGNESEELRAKADETRPAVAAMKQVVACASVQSTVEVQAASQRLQVLLDSLAADGAPVSPQASGSVDESLAGDEDKSEKWEQWKIRRDAKKALSAKTKYGDWLKDMADGFAG